MHHSNYAVLENEPGHGIKYCPHLAFEDEFFLLRALDHDQIPKAYEHGKEMMYKDDKEVLNQNFIVLDHMSSHDFVGYFKGKTTQFKKNLESIIKCIISACDPIEYLHSKDYVHTDIKPGHLMLDIKNSKVFFIDFELAIKKHSLIKGISKDYAAPEHEKLLKLLREAPEDIPLEAFANEVPIDGRADIFSLGTIMYEILTQKKWAEAKSPPRELNQLIPEELARIVMATLEEEPENRIGSAKELKEELIKIQ